MIFRSALILSTVMIGMQAANPIYAGCFGKRSCCQDTPVVCPQSCVPTVTSTVRKVCPQVTTSTAYCPAPATTFSTTGSSGFPKILIEKLVPRTVTSSINGPAGNAVLRTETFMETQIVEASPTEALEIVNSKLDQLNEKVFGAAPNPKTPLEERIKKLETPTSN